MTVGAAASGGADGTTSPDPDSAGLAARAAEAVRLLGPAVAGQVSTGLRRRVEYSSDAGNYRVLPEAVAAPRDLDDVLAILAVCRATGLPLTCRGGGTSVAGSAIGPGIVMDFSRHLDRIVELDPVSRSAVVQPGVVLGSLQRAAAQHGLRFGPDPSTHSRATLGGMIGTNACGPHSIAHGRTVDNVRSITAVDGAGRQFTGDGGRTPALDALVAANLAVLRTEFGRFPRQLSGYGLEHLLPEQGRNLSRALVGSEGTLAVLLEATVELVPVTHAQVLVILGYPDMVSAADAVPTLLAHCPQAIEGLDARLVDVVRAHRGRSSVPELPAGGGWLMVEIGGASPAAARSAADLLVADAAALEAMVLPAGPAAAALWRIREDGAGLAGQAPSGRPAWPGWEDAAVPPAALGGYLREVQVLLEEYRLTGIPYGHFGDGCVHLRLDLPLDNGPEGVAVFDRFLHDAARLVIAHGGSPSGEHGDGRARSGLLPMMFSPSALDLLAAVKAVFDPAGILNPGIVVAPRPAVADLRRPAARPVPAAGGFSFVADGGDLTAAVHRCTGVGRCRADDSAAGSFMCPSFLATGHEKDVTRGRARVLQELTQGSPVIDWHGPELAQSLDLCLGCKACASDCPTGTDVARYRAEVLFRRHHGPGALRRPVVHHTLGRLPQWISVLRRLPGPLTGSFNAVLGRPALAGGLLRLAGIDPRRHAPRIAPTSIRRDWAAGTGRGRGGHAAPGTAPAGPVALWLDSFTDGFDPGTAVAAAAVLEGGGHTVQVPAGPACCGLTWITTGQLGGARRRLLRLLDTLEPIARQGVPIVGMEPSCVAVLRGDLPDLLPDDPRAHLVSRSVRTLAEQLSATAAWHPPDLTGLRVLVQPHCHHHAVMGFDTDRQLLARTGATVQQLAGCCGLAGDFGMTPDHYELSVEIAELALLPALRGRVEGTVVLADGFSCRTQIADLGGVTAVSLARLLSGSWS